MSSGTFKIVMMKTGVSHSCCTLEQQVKSSVIRYVVRFWRSRVKDVSCLPSRIEYACSVGCECRHAPVWKPHWSRVRGPVGKKLCVDVHHMKKTLRMVSNEARRACDLDF